MPRIAHFVSHPIQYFAPLYRALSQSPEIDLTVFFASDFGTKPSFDSGLSKVVQFDVPLLDGYQHQFLKNSAAVDSGLNLDNFQCPELAQTLQQGQFDLVWIHGWGHQFQRQVAAAARRVGIPYVLRGESTLLEAPLYSIRWWRRWWKHRSILRHAAACWYVGIRNREFLTSMGVENNRLFPAHYSVDTEFFAQRLLPLHERACMRAGQGVAPGDLVVVTIAKLIGRKRVDDVIRAVGACSNSIKLWVLGDGKDAEMLKELAERVAPGRVTWFGFTNQQAIPEVLSAADVFVLASDEETWGLVTNEAMSCGLPAIVSDKVGCGADLVSPGKTGFTYQCGDVPALADCIKKMFDSRTLAELKAAAKDRVLEHYSVRATAHQIVDATQALCVGKSY